MDRMLVAVFDHEAKAEEAKNALLELDRDREVTVYGYAVVVKHADGTATVSDQNVGPLGVLIGTSLGSMIGLLGGPTGLAIGAASGLTLGSLADMSNALIGAEFVEDVTKVLTPNKAALVAEIDEDSTELVDQRLEAGGGILVRRSLSSLAREYRREDIAAMKADVAQFKAELARERSERKAKLQEKIDQLDRRILAQLLQADERQAVAEKEARIKREILRKNINAVGRAIRDLANTPV